MRTPNDRVSLSPLPRNSSSPQIHILLTLILHTKNRYTPNANTSLEHTHLAVPDESRELRVDLLVLLVRVDGVPVPAAKLPVGALHAAGLVPGELADQYVRDARHDLGLALLPPQLGQELEVYVHEDLQLREHPVEGRAAVVEVALEALDEDALHGQEHEAVVLLREDELVDVLLALGLALVVVDQPQGRLLAAERRAPGLGVVAAQPELRVLGVEVVEAELLGVVEVEILHAAAGGARKIVKSMSYTRECG